MTTAAIYIRANSKLDLDLQMAKLMKYAKKNGYSVKKKRIYSDLRKSAKDLNRPGLNQLLNECRYKDIDSVIVADHTRLARKMGDRMALQIMLSVFKTKVVVAN